ncbi:4-carboxymuconolactone decarboxylase [Arcicella aurantiaca]|uniref:4-carboxymuconolactone decarboxylase n=1 Tax=Arcicella aurantiaca TaxID=591202 RepID=A0A316DGE6_9BACT|nr:carboxymuconolactone decarboxylase family protein [Arcicella aurantiaca]PWK16975.1 4-carboxymuconolactone decarboxylase [Arcicella aurantiaca]
MDNQKKSEKRKSGLEMMDAVYGEGFSDRLKENNSLIVNETLEHLFASVWSRPNLSIKDRRLLIIGVTAATGKRETLKIQALGALKNNELSPDELREAALHLAYYAGWEKGMEATQAFEEAIRSLNEK